LGPGSLCSYVIVVVLGWSWGSAVCAGLAMSPAVDCRGVAVAASLTADTGALAAVAVADVAEMAAAPGAARTAADMYGTGIVGAAVAAVVGAAVAAAVAAAAAPDLAPASPNNARF